MKGKGSRFSEKGWAVVLELQFKRIPLAVTLITPVYAI
jgi:hypothetical protein